MMIITTVTGQIMMKIAEVGELLRKGMNLFLSRRVSSARSTCRWTCPVQCENESLDFRKES
jgi:hypothetical protein